MSQANINASKTTLKRTLVRIFLVILYIGIILLLANFGKGHTVHIINERFVAADGTTIEAVYTCHIKGAVPQSPFITLVNNISKNLSGKLVYSEPVLKYPKGVPGQIVVDWHKKNIIFEYYSGTKLVKKIEKEVVMDKNISQYLWNVAALFEDNPGWCTSYIIEETEETGETSSSE